MRPIKTFQREIAQQARLLQEKLNDLPVHSEQISPDGEELIEQIEDMQELQRELLHEARMYQEFGASATDNIDYRLIADVHTVVHSMHRLNEVASLFYFFTPSEDGQQIVWGVYADDPSAAAAESHTGVLNLQDLTLTVQGETIHLPKGKWVAKETIERMKRQTK